MSSPLFRTLALLSVQRLQAADYRVFARLKAVQKIAGKYRVINKIESIVKPI